MDIRVKIQPIKSIPTPFSYPLVDVTDRLTPSSLRNIEERVEQGRFASCANDLDFEFVNFDGYFDEANANNFPGYCLRVYIDGEEQYRGDAYFQDISFERGRDKTVKIRSYTWLKRLRETNLDSPTFFGNVDDILADLWVEINPAVNLSPPFDGIEYELEGIELTEANLLIGSFADLWWDSRTQSWWGVRYSTRRDGTDGVLDVDLFKIYSRTNRVLVASWSISHSEYDLLGNALEPQLSLSSASFVRSVISTDYIAVYSVLGFGTTVANRRYKRTITVIYISGSMILDSDISDVEIGSATPVENVLLLEDGTLREFMMPVWSDGKYYYLAEHDSASPDDITLKRYTSAGVYLAEYTLAGVHLAATDSAWRSIHTPSENLIIWRQAVPLPLSGVSAPWHWIKVNGTTHVIDSSGIGDVYDWAAGISPTLTNHFPIGYTDGDNTGKYSYWKRGGQWWTNDVRFTFTIQLNYDGDVSIEQILLDICQLCNGYLYVYNGTIYLYSRGFGRSEHIISEAWINSERYPVELIDSTRSEPVLSIKSSGFTDNSEDPYDNTTVLGVLRRYYRDELQKRWNRKRLTIPTQVALAMHLGDFVTITETAEKGVILLRDLGLERGNRLSELEIEYEITKSWSPPKG